MRNFMEKCVRFHIDHDWTWFALSMLILDSITDIGILISFSAEGIILDIHGLRIASWLFKRYKTQPHCYVCRNICRRYRNSRPYSYNITIHLFHYGEED